MSSVTVVVPTCNRPGLLRRTLRSILRQVDIGLEVIVVDDASDDDPAAVVAAQDDARIRLVRLDRRLGPNAARNRGILEASGEWIAFCDDDDLWAPDKLAQQLAAAQESGRDWVYAGSVFVNEQLQVRGGGPPLAVDAMVSALKRFNALPAAASNVVVRASFLRRTGNFDPGLPHLSDWDLWIRLARAGRPACAAAPLVAYQLHSANFSFSTVGMVSELAVVERRHGMRADRRRFYRYLGHMSLKARRRGSALSHFARAALHARDRYTRDDAAFDARVLLEHAAGLARRRLRLPVPTRARPPLEAAPSRDPNAAWKAQAQAWLDELPD